MQGVFHCLYRRHKGLWVCQCLDYDVTGTGSTRDDALKSAVEKCHGAMILHSCGMKKREPCGWFAWLRFYCFAILLPQLKKAGYVGWKLD